MGKKNSEKSKLEFGLFPGVDIFVNELKVSIEPLKWHKQGPEK